MKKWEYCEAIITWSNYGFYKARYSESMTVNGFDTIVKTLNYFGEEGWELVSVSETNYIFKRELRSN